MTYSKYVVYVSVSQFYNQTQRVDWNFESIELPSKLIGVAIV